MPEMISSPQETITSLSISGQNKGNLGSMKMVVLGILAGAYIGFGAHLSTTVTTGIADIVGFGLSKVIGGAVFSVGLMMVVIAGAELFTGNSLMIISLLDKKVGLNKLLRNWILVWLANFAGALLLAGMVFLSGVNGTGENITPVGKTAISIAYTKANLSFSEIFFRAVLANWLVCIAVVMATAAKDAAGKILACLAPITAFVTMGFEHSVANMYFIPAGIFASMGLAASWPSAIYAICVATLGNIVGGVTFVALTYWYSYSREKVNAN